MTIDASFIRRTMQSLTSELWGIGGVMMLGFGHLYTACAMIVIALLFGTLAVLVVE